MSIANLGELKAALAGWATRADLDAQMDDFVGWAHQEIRRRLRGPALHARADVAVAAETAPAPDGFLAARRLYLDVTPRRVLRQTDAASLADVAASLALCDYPSHFAVEGGDTLVFAPLFGGQATGKLLYYRAPDALAQDGDSNVVLAKYPFLYLWGGLEALYRYLEDDANCDRYGGLFGALIDSVNACETADALRGPLVAPAGSGAVV
ncbi:MAG TPA: hypothetical protein VJS38_02500 [Phenylobacterium sp.]|uniref:phage adaptor protein n=1 Tax=Phenylobacterium sp. TaxID=1871053 RepID=UPI002B4A7DC8|nr:hypothetical protein [Phenylobacterium sp.]HKR87019.1 hypothetical protein [Phenylobacterium sp.]